MNKSAENPVRTWKLVSHGRSYSKDEWKDNTEAALPEA